MLQKKNLRDLLVLALLVLSGCTSLRQPHPMTAKTSAEIDAAAREMHQAALQQSERSPAPTGR